MLTNIISGFSADCTFNPPASIHTINLCENELGILFPDHLKALLLESNGISGKYGLGLLWTTEEILSTNIEFRNNPDFKNLYMPFDNLLFFADAGNGDQFAFSILNGTIKRNDIFAWNHEDDSRSWVAPDLLKYMEWWLKDELKI